MAIWIEISESSERQWRHALLRVIFCLCVGFGSGFGVVQTAQAEEDAPVQTESAVGSDQVETSDESASETFVPDTASGVSGVFGDRVVLQLFDRQQLLGSPVNTAEYYFKVLEGMTFESAILNLHITSSDTLIDERSAISVDVNGNRIDTVPINSIGTNGNGWWNLEIPVEYLQAGALNELSFTTAQRSVEGDCADIDNPSNWVGIEASSYFEMTVADYPVFTLSSAFDTFFDSIFAGADLSAEFVFPQGSDQVVLQDGALTLASAAGAYRTGVNRVDFSRAAGASSPASDHAIFLGWQDDWASTFTSRPLQDVAAGQGYLETAGGFNVSGGPQLLVSGADDEGIRRALGLAAAPSYLEQLSGTSAVVTSDIADKKEWELSDDGVYSFADLGFETVSLAGAFHQSTSFTITQPNNMQSGPSSTVTINFSHSKALQTDRSLLTVKIDDIEIDSVQLSDSNATDGTIAVTIPEEARAKANIVVTVDVYNYIGKVDCSKDYYDVAWTVIDASSSVFFDPSDRRLRPRLSEFLQFNLWKETPGSKVVLRSSFLSDTALNLAARTGQKNAVSFDFASTPLDEPLRDTDRENNIIYVGSVSELALPDEVQNALSAAPQPDGSFVIAQDAPFIHETLADKVVFQVIRSPWNYDKYIYVIAYPDGKESLAADIVGDGDLINSLEGTISCVDDAGMITSYDAFSDEAGEEAPLSLEIIKYKVYERFGVPLWWFVSGIVVLLLLVFLMVRLARKQAQFKQMEQKMKDANRELEEARLDEDTDQSV